MEIVAQARARDVSDVLRLQAQRNPTKVALSYEGTHDNFAQLDEHVSRVANALRESGIEKGDRVALLSHNSRSFVILRFATIRAGAIFTPINFRLNAREVAYILEHSGARAFIAEDSLCEVASEALDLIDRAPPLKAYIAHSGVPVPSGWIAADDWLNHPDSERPHGPLADDDPVQIMYTSGTESRPKGALISSRSLFAQYASCIVDGGMTADDVELHCLPLYHCAQLDCFLSVDLYLGARSILLRSPDPATMLRVIERERVTKLFSPPTVWISLLRHPDFEKRDITSLIKGYYGASVMPTAVIEELSARAPHLQLWNFYGQTEMSPLATVLGPAEQLRKLGSAGRPALNVETMVVDDQDRPVAANVVGEIVHRGPHAMLGYFNDPEKTRASFVGGWFHSGDLGRFDEDGYLYVVDRKKDMIKTGGENVASREVEEVLFSHSNVSEAAVFGLPDEKWIEAVTAVIVLREEGLTSVDDIDLYCRAKLAPYKCPKAIYLSSDLPKNASGKVLKRDLRQVYLDARR